MVEKIERGEEYYCKEKVQTPLFIRSPVIKGFGRGSKELGCPTANVDPDQYPELEHMACGVYFGWAQVPSMGPEVRKMVMNVGFNPFYNNDKKALEIHVLHEYDDDFYGDELRAIVLQYVRPEANFSSVQELKDAINEDIRFASRLLDQDQDCSAFQRNPFFKLN